MGGSISQTLVARTPSSASYPLVRLCGHPKKPTWASAADQGVRPTLFHYHFVYRLIVVFVVDANRDHLFTLPTIDHKMIIFFG